MPKFKKINESLRVSLSERIAKVNLRATLPTQEISDEAKRVLGEASLFYGDKRARSQDNVEVPTRMPALTDDRYVFARFRALSQVHLVNRGLDFTKPGVLEAAVTLLSGKTVYLNHDFSDVDNWVGVVSKAYWDADGAKSGGTAGINCEVKIDAYLNYRTACGVTMTPPAVNAMSLTVVFEFDYSHPELVEQRRFWNLLGEEVDGEIVRLIVTNIQEIWEASLVPVGEDRLAKNHGSDDEESDEESFSAKAEEAAEIPPPNSNEEKTMKLTSEQKAKLGIEFDGEDVPETALLAAGESLAAKLAAAVDQSNIAELTVQAEAGRQYVELQRTEVTRLAKLAELGGDEGELDAVVTDDIKAASFDRLTQLKAYYEKKIGDKYPTGGRSSLEGSEAVDAAGGVAQTQKTAVPEDGLFS